MARYDEGGAKGAAAAPGTRYRVPMFSLSVSIVAVLFHTRALLPPALPRPFRLESNPRKHPTQTARPVPVPGLYEALQRPSAAPGLRAAGRDDRVWCAVGSDASLRWTGPIMSRENAVQSSREFSWKVTTGDVPKIRREMVVNHSTVFFHKKQNVLCCKFFVRAGSFPHGEVGGRAPAEALRHNTTLS